MNHFVHCCSFSTSNKITSKGCRSASQTCDFDAKMQNFSGEGAQPPPQTPSLVGRRTHRRLDRNPSPHSEILPTLYWATNFGSNTTIEIIARITSNSCGWIRTLYHVVFCYSRQWKRTGNYLWSHSSAVAQFNTSHYITFYYSGLYVILCLSWIVSEIFNVE